jgi:glyceraldehyde 3-phosphate dehydrogenase
MNVAINGFGRIGRAVFKLALEKKIKVVAINDIHGIQDAAYLLQHDSIYGRYNKKVIVKENHLVVDGKKIVVLNEKDPRKLPWRKLGVTLVIESTGAFRDPEEARQHIQSGSKQVIITAPCTLNPPDITIVPGVNDHTLKKSHKIISLASCTTNCLAPIVHILHKNFTIKKALFTTIHAYTNDQDVHDGYHKKTRRGRAAALNIIPTTTGAAESVCTIMPELVGKINGLAVRVPVSVGSLVDLVAELDKNFTREHINKVLEKASKGPLKKIVEYSKEELVSSDIIGNLHSAVIDSLSTQKEGNLVKILAWYDNEYGYSQRVVDIISRLKNR